MIRDTLNDLFSSRSPLADRCLAAAGVVLMLSLVGLLGLLGFTVVDSAGIAPTETVVTVIEAKLIIPSDVTNILAGKVMFPIFHSKSNMLKFRINGKVVSFKVKEKLFNDVNVGDRIRVDYGFRRLSNLYQPTGIKLVDRRT